MGEWESADELGNWSALLTLSPSPPLPLILFLLVALLPLAVRAQETPPDTTQRREAFVQADRLVKDSETTRQLIGDVRVRQDSTLLFSSRAVQYLDRNAFLFTGNVLIVEVGDSLRADTVYYDRGTKIGRARGHVELTDGEVDVRAPSGVYFVREKRAQFEEGLTLIDSTSTLTSRTGTYWMDEKRAEVADSVQLHAERTYLEADSLTYFRETEISIARGEVFIDRIGGDDDAEADSTQRTFLFSQYAYHDERAGLSRVHGHPLLVQLRKDSTEAAPDTLVMRAQHLEALDSDSLRRLVAVDSVRIWQHDFAAVADSVVYERLGPPVADSLAADTLATPAMEETRLYRQPVAWMGEAQVSGDTLRVAGHDGAIDSLFAHSNAFVAQRDSVLERINQVQGQNLVGVFQEDSTRIFTFFPNVEAIYFRRDAEDRPDGGVQISGDRATFWFRGDDLEQIIMPTENQGTLYDEGILPTPFQLDGFRWLPERRPTKAGLVNEQAALRLHRAMHPPPLSPFVTIPPVTDAETEGMQQP